MSYAKSDKADKKIRRDLEIVTKRIVRELKPVSVILFRGLVGAKEVI